MPERLSAAQARQAAEALIGARQALRRLPDLPEGCGPASEADGYAIQAEHVRLLRTQCAGGGIAGYKIGCTNVTAQAQLGVPGPFAGVLLQGYVRESPARIAAADGFMRMIEAEVAFRFGRTLPARSGGYDVAELEAAVAEAMPAIEVVDSRYVDWTTIGAARIIADNASAGFWVHGTPTADWRGIDWTNLAVQVTRNGQPAESGNTANVLGNPFNALAWLSRHLGAQGVDLEAGWFVTTGTTIAVNPAEAGDTVEADFGSLGKVSVSFT